MILFSVSLSENLHVNITSLTTAIVHRDEYSPQTRISTANEIVRFYICQTRPMTITLVFRDRHTDHYSFRSPSGERAFSSTNIKLCSLSKTHSIFRLHSQDIRSMNGKSLLALTHNFLRIQEVYHLILLIFSPMLQLM
jgi:hypothetical protein